MRESANDKLILVMNNVLLLLIGLSCFAPLVNILSLSLSGKVAVETGKVTLWPIDFGFESYRMLFKGTRIVESFLNGVEITVVGVLLSMFFTIMAAYPLSRPYFFGRRFYSLAIIFTMIFTGGLIPTYLVVKSLGLIDTYASLWFPLLISTYNTLIMKSSFENIPIEVEEAARIDGCNEWRLLAQVVLPLSLPVLATLTLFYGVNYWNSFMNVLIYINSTEKYNITVLVQQMIQSQTLLLENMQSDSQTSDLVPEGIKAAGIIVLVLPMVVLYPFLQKYFIKGVMLGSVKG